MGDVVKIDTGRTTPEEFIELLSELEKETNVESMVVSITYSTENKPIPEQYSYHVGCKGRDLAYHRLCLDQYIDGLLFDGS